MSNALQELIEVDEASDLLPNDKELFNLRDVVASKDSIMANMRSLHAKQINTLREVINDEIAEKTKLQHEVINLQMKCDDKDYKIANLKKYKEWYKGERK
tara:strand:+ start:1893 stop:2192 length:300 start_codon:yes stop_codon:yes gene_type:complete